MVTHFSRVDNTQFYQTLSRERESVDGQFFFCLEDVPCSM